MYYSSNVSNGDDKDNLIDYVADFIGNLTPLSHPPVQVMSGLFGHRHGACPKPYMRKNKEEVVQDTDNTKDQKIR